MPVIIPLNSDGNRQITVDMLAGGVYQFRSYFSQGSNGIYDGWFLDIADSIGTTLIDGVRITPGCPNLLKGQGDNFHGVQVACAVISGVETSLSALGNGTYLVWFNPGETNPFTVGDPLIDIPYDEWAFHQGTGNRFFDNDGYGNIKVKRTILAGSTDKLTNLDPVGGVSVKSTAGIGAENEYFRANAGGNMVLKG